MSERDWCCERLEEETGSFYGWGRRTVEEGPDGTLTLISRQKHEGEFVNSPVSFDYCPFCGEEVDA